MNEKCECPISSQSQSFLEFSMALALQRIQLSTSINGLPERQVKKLKSFIQHFLWKAGVGCDVQRIRHSLDSADVSTTILIEAPTNIAYSAQKDLIEALKFEFAGIPIDPPDKWVAEESKEELVAAKISKTIGSIHRDGSSGDVSKSVPLRHDANSDSQSVSSWVSSLLKKTLESLPVAQALQTAGKIQPRVVHVHYGGRVAQIEISLRVWDAFKQKCCQLFDIKYPIRDVCEYRGGKMEIIDGLELLKDDVDLYIAAEGDPELTPPPQIVVSLLSASREARAFASMEEFHEALKSEEGLDDRQLSIIQAALKKEEIGFKQLPRLTDEKLEKYGLKQGGLREAILAVLGK